MKKRSLKESAFCRGCMEQTDGYQISHPMAYTKVQTDVVHTEIRSVATAHFSEFCIISNELIKTCGMVRDV